jgi:UDP-N-acetylmuramoyl-tripeptide--D-alanyl-D-alanine ligase
MPGGVFFALKGAATDGHRFVADAVRRGAAGVVVAEPVETDGAEVIRVTDTWQALYDAATAALSAASPRVFAITGSNGKTSTKEMLAAALSRRYKVLKTEGNLNTETGVPLTLLRLEPGIHDALVLEMGMQAPGEIAHLARIAQPQVGVITGIGSVHAEFFADGKQGIARAKAELLEALPKDGLAVLNHDDPMTETALRPFAPAPVVTFGLEGGDFHGTGYARGGFTIGGVRVQLRLPGRHQALNALAAIAAADFAGVPLTEAAVALSSVEVGRRLQPLPTPAGYEVLDDAYNASPESMLAAFETVAERRPRRLLGVLGEMRELGDLAVDAHRMVGEAAAATFDALCVVDVGQGRLLAEAAGAELVPDQSAAAEWVQRNARPGDVVLVKASHGVALEDVVNALLEPRL